MSYEEGFRAGLTARGNALDAAPATPDREMLREAVRMLILFVDGEMTMGGIRRARAFVEKAQEAMK